MQSYDFLVLNRKYGCVLELGGDDQWSNIIGGVELVRKKENKEVFGMTFALLTNSEGKKWEKLKVVQFGSMRIKLHHTILSILAQCRR